MVWSHVRVRTDLPPEEAFARVTRWEDHVVPFTRIRRTPDGFVARTAVGPLGFDDPMRIEAWEPPHRVVIRKLGRVILGEAEIVVAGSAGGTVVTWHEQARVRGLPRLFDPIVRRATGVMLRSLLRRLLA